MVTASRPAFACRPALKISLKHCFSEIFSWFQMKNYWKTLMNKKGWKRSKKVFWPAFMCTQHLKTGQNTQHPPITSEILGLQGLGQDLIFWKKTRWCPKYRLIFITITVTIKWNWTNRKLIFYPFCLLLICRKSFFTHWTSFFQAFYSEKPCK